MWFLVILLLCAVFGFAIKGLMLVLMYPKKALIIVAAGIAILALIVVVGFAILTLIDKHDKNGRGRKKVRELARRFYKEGTKEAEDAYEKAVRKFPYNWDYAMRTAIRYDTGAYGLPFNPKEAQKWYDLVRKAAGKNEEVRKFFEFYEYPSFANYATESDMHSQMEHRRRIAAALLMNVKSRGSNMYSAIDWKQGGGVYDMNELYGLFKEFFGENGVATKIAAVYKRRNEVVANNTECKKDNVHQQYLNAVSVADSEQNQDKEDRAYAAFLQGMFMLDDPEFYKPKLPDKYAALKRNWTFEYNGEKCTMEQFGFRTLYNAAFDGSIPALYTLFAHEEYMRPPYTDFSDSYVKATKDVLFLKYLISRHYEWHYEWDEVTQALAKAGFPDRSSPEDWSNYFSFPHMSDDQQDNGEHS